VKRCQKQKKNMALFKQVNELLVAGEQMPAKNRDHI
jgi:mRNA-degrading endonuclease YafQ of YafQ-DinJ toxin-antitoxin module